MRICSEVAPGQSQFISRILDRGQEPKIEILIHGLEDEPTALKVEAAIIDLIGKEKLTNRVRGWQSGVFGRVEVNQLISHYEREKVNIDEPAILIRINRLFRYDMTDIELYDATRGVWRIGENREKGEHGGRFVRSPKFLLNENWLLESVSQSEKAGTVRDH